MTQMPPMDLKIADTASGWVWHYTADGKVTPCGRAVASIKAEAVNADCRNCLTKAGLRRSNRR